MKYNMERQYCFRLNLARPDQERLCRYIDERNKEQYPYLPGYLLAACTALEGKEELPLCHLFDQSMERIREELSRAVSEIKQHMEKQ